MITAETRNIVTSFWAKPIPDRRFDWEAWYEGTEDWGMVTGYGRTEEEAIADLLENYEDTA